MGTVLVRSSEVGGNSGASVLMEVRDSGMQGQEFLRSAGIFEANLAPLLLSCGPMRLFDQVIAASSRDHLDVLHSVEHGKFSNRCSITPELIRVDDVWNVIVQQKPSEKGLCCLGISPILQKEVKDRARFIDSPPQPTIFAPDLDADLVQEPPGTPAGFPVPQFLSEQRCKLDVPLAQRLVAGVDAALLEEFLDITLT